MNKIKRRVMQNPVFQLLQHAAQEFQEDKATRLAAALAYHTALSLAPLLLVIVAVAGLIFGRDAALGFLLDEVTGLIGKDGADLIDTMLQEANQERRSVLAAIIGSGTLLLGATGVFNHLHEALNQIWDVPEEKRSTGILGAVRTRLFSFGMVLSVGFLLLVSLAISAGLSALDRYVQNIVPAAQLLLIGLNFAVSLALISVLFAAMYKILPDKEIAWRDVWVGAGITGGLFSIGKFLIGLYLGNSSVGSAYGAAGSFVVLLVWIYYSAQIFFFGAELTLAFANRFGSRRDQAVLGAHATEHPAPEETDAKRQATLDGLEPVPVQRHSAPPWQKQSESPGPDDHAQPLVVQGMVVQPEPLLPARPPEPSADGWHRRWVSLMAICVLLVGTVIAWRQKESVEPKA